MAYNVGNGTLNSLRACMTAEIKKEKGKEQEEIRYMKNSKIIKRYRSHVLGAKQTYQNLRESSAESSGQEPIKGTSSQRLQIIE